MSAFMLKGFSFSGCNSRSIYQKVKKKLDFVIFKCLIVTKLCVCFQKGVIKSSKVKEWCISSKSVSMQVKFVISAIHSYLIRGRFIDGIAILFVITLLFYLRSEHFALLIRLKRLFMFIQIMKCPILRIENKEGNRRTSAGKDGHVIGDYYAPVK